ncbi:MAG TPA: glycosyltransferase family 4 protein, partial [Candidatus Krumholzibacteria bacterium]
LMLGWEFPPFISGGLGTACRGLTEGLKRADARVLFVLPRAIDAGAPPGSDPNDAASIRYASPGRRRIDRVVVAAVSSAIASPYLSDHETAERETFSGTPSSLRVMGVGAGEGYDGDLLAKIQAYAQRCVQLARRELFDVIHAHDWMTYPAAMAISAVSGRPIVAHVHATEYDRSSDPTGTIYDIERRGMQAAARVVTVSRHTRDIVLERYGVPGDRVTVVHNGIDAPAAPHRHTNGHDPTVLFLGRVTRQKGPRFFIRAAARVAARIPAARFVVAGAGDEMNATVTLARELGISDRVTFPGFLHGADVDRAYDGASVYVMPSVSEPFGLTALEAASRGVPVIVSNTSGAAEVLVNGSLKVDYWDVDAMARMITAVITKPGLGESLVRESRREVASATWDAAAHRCVRIYHEVTGRSAAGVPDAMLAGV